MTKLLSLGLLTLMIVGFIQGLSPLSNKIEVKTSRESYNSQTIPLSEQIKLARLENGMSQQELAEKTQLTKYNIEAIEKGEAVPTGEILRRFEKSLDTKLAGIR